MRGYNPLYASEAAPPRRRYSNPVVENEQEIVFRASLWERRITSLIALACLSPWAMCVRDLLATDSMDGNTGYLEAHLAFGVALIPFVVLFFSFTSPNETCFDLVRRTYRMRRYKPWPMRRGRSPRGGAPFWVQETRGPLDDVLGLELQSLEPKDTISYSVCVVWKDVRRAPAFLEVRRTQREASSLMKRLADALSVPMLTGERVTLAS